MVYLNNVEEGGETEFPKAGLKVKPEIGTVLFWHDMVDGVPYLKSEHEAMPPIKGEKWACTYWIREHTFNQKVINGFLILSVKTNAYKIRSIKKLVGML